MWTPGSYSWGRDRFSLRFLPPSGQGEAGAGKGQGRDGGVPAPLTALQPGAPKGSHKRQRCFRPPTLHPSLTCLLWSSHVPGVTFTLTLQPGHRAVNPAPLIGARGKFTSEEVGKDGANGVMEMAPSGTAPPAAASGEDGRASRGPLKPPPTQGTSTETPELLGVGPQGEHPQVGTRARAPLPSSRAALGSPQSSPQCRVSELLRPHGVEVPWGGGVPGWGLWGQGAPASPRLQGHVSFRLVAGSRGVRDSPPGSRGAAPGVASAGAARELAVLSPAQHPVPARSGPRRGGGLEGTSLRALRPLPGRETEARSTPASGEAAPGCPPARALHGVPAWLGGCPPLPSPSRQHVAGTSGENHLQPSKQRELPPRAAGNRGKVQGLAELAAPRAAPGEKTPARSPAGVRDPWAPSVLPLLWGYHRDPSPRGPFLVPQTPCSILGRASSQGQTCHSQGQAPGSLRDRQTKLVTYKIHLY